MRSDGSGRGRDNYAFLPTDADALWKVLRTWRDAGIRDMLADPYKRAAFERVHGATDLAEIEAKLYEPEEGETG